jgi:hypothetical protein
LEFLLNKDKNNVNYGPQTNYANEEITWITPSPRSMDLDAVLDVDFIRSKRRPILKKFSVEVDHHYIDSKTISSLIECKVSDF